MKDFKIFFIVELVFVIFSFFACKSIQIDYWVVAVIVYFNYVVLYGYCSNKSFYSGYAGMLEASEENRNIRLLSFVCNVIAFFVLVCFLVDKYFLC